MKLVSIVTPSLNQAAFIKQAIRSVLEQDYPGIEYLIVDGGSTDGSLSIIKQYSDRLAWWSSEPDAGQADAINKGIKRAHGEIVAWLNSDDFYLPGAIAAAVRSFEQHQDAVLVYGNMLAVDENGRTINRLVYRQFTLEELICFEIIGQPAVFIQRSALEAAGGLNIYLHFLFDHQLWIKIARQGPIFHADENWAAARFHPAAKNRAQAAQFGYEAFLIHDWLSKDASMRTALAKVESRSRASAHRVNARYLLDGNQPWAALRAWFRAFLIHPPTAMKRLNLAASALLELIGLGTLRTAALHERQKRISA